MLPCIRSLPQVLKNSSREEMCNSVLKKHDADLVSKNDLSQEGKDVAAAYVGQDLQLLWTQKGVDSEMGRNYTWLQPKPEAGEEVTEQLLQLQPNIRKKALQEDWFKERKLERASLIQMQDTPTSCIPKEMETCTDDMLELRISVCAKQEGWLYSHVPKKMSCKKMIDTKKMAKSPYECFNEVEYGTVGTIKHYAFHYNKANAEQPITCYAQPDKSTCNLRTPPELVQKDTVIKFDSVWLWVDAPVKAKTSTP